MIKENLQKYKEEFKKCIEDLKHKKTFYKQIPNLITLVRLLGTIPAYILLLTGNSVAAVVLMTILLATDLIDGKLARKWHVESKLGADLDAVGDKMIFLGMILPIIIKQPLLLINVIFETVISVVNILGRAKGLDTKTVYTGKVKTCFLSLTLIAGYLVHFFKFPSYILKALIATTGISQSVALYDYIKNYNKMRQDKQTELNMNENQTVEDEKQQERTTHEIIEQLKREKEFLISTKEVDKEQLNKCKKRKKN